MIQDLAKKYPPPSDPKLERRIQRLERMASFYKSKINEAPEKQALMFAGFESALNYAITTIKIYRKLTIAIAEEANSDTIKQ